MSFIRFPLSRISLPTVPCELPLQFLDYYPFSEFRLGYIKLPDRLKSNDSSELRKDLFIGQFAFTSLSGFSFDDSDEFMKFMFDDGVIVRNVLDEASKCNISPKDVSKSLCDKCCILVFFADSTTGTRFRKRFMCDLLHAFDRIKLQHTPQDVADRGHVSEPSTSFAHTELKRVKLLYESRTGNTDKQYLLLRHPLHSEICGSEQESEFAFCKGTVSNQQKTGSFGATDSETPSSPEKDLTIVSVQCDKGGRNKTEKFYRPSFLAPGLYIPPRLFYYLDGDLLSPFAKIQTLGSRNLLASVRTHLFKRGENGGILQMNIARELSNPGYWRHVAQLWKSYDEKKSPSFDFAFSRLASFLEWTLQTLDFVSDFGRLSAEELMLCRNTRWHETAATRKKFDQKMREYFINEEELHGVRNWVGILREKTLFDAAFSRASYLRVLDLGTMVAEGSFGSWNLRDLFKKLDNLTDLTWLNCHLDGDECPLLELRNVEKLKRLVLHITKYDRNKFQQFFDRFGWIADDEAYEIIEADAPYEDGANDFDAGGYDTDDSFVDDRDEEELMNDRDDVSGGSLSIEINPAGSRDVESTSSTKTATDVQLDYAGLSFAYSLYRTKQFTKRQLQTLEVFAKMFDVPKAVLMAKSIALNVPSICLRRALNFTGTRQLEMFSVGLPLDLCSNIRPNRTPYRDIIEILDNMGHFVNRNWEHKEARFHVMVDYYAPERVLHLSNLVANAFPAAERMYLRLETARIRDKDFYSFRRHMTDKTVPRNLCLFDLSIDALTYRIPSELPVLECYTLEEFHLTLSGIRPSLTNEKVKEDLSVIVNKLMNSSILPKLHTIMFKINAPFLSDLCEMFVNATNLGSCNSQIRTLGLICTAAQIRCCTISNKIRNVYLAIGRHLERLVLDVRVLGSFTKEELSRLRDSLPTCSLEALLGPEDCKYIDFDRKEIEDDCYRSPSNSPHLDEGFDRHLCSDYSDEVIVQFDDSSRVSTGLDESSQATTGLDGLSLVDDNSQPSSSQEILLNMSKGSVQSDIKINRVLRSGREIAPGPSSSSSCRVRKRQPRKIQKMVSSGSESDPNNANEFCGKTGTRRRQKRIMSSAEESDGSLLEGENSRKQSFRHKETNRKRRVVELDCSNNASEASLSSNSDEWSPNKSKKPRRSRRNRRN